MDSLNTELVLGSGKQSLMQGIMMRSKRLPRTHSQKPPRHQWPQRLVMTSKEHRILILRRGAVVEVLLILAGNRLDLSQFRTDFEQYRGPPPVSGHPTENGIKQRMNAVRDREDGKFISSSCKDTKSNWWRLVRSNWGIGRDTGCRGRWFCKRWFLLLTMYWKRHTEARFNVICFMVFWFWSRPFFLCFAISSVGQNLEKDSDSWRRGGAGPVGASFGPGGKPPFHQEF